jgi:hypothetical protein
MGMASRAGGDDARAWTLYCQDQAGVCSQSTGNAASRVSFGAMRFLNKYDLREPITGGPIKVYEASEFDTGLRRLVYILPWKEMPAEVSTLQVLEQFRQQGPDPPGIILDAGRTEQGNEIYLVTSFPSDPLSVQRWVNAYCAMSGHTVAQPPAPPPASPEPAAKPPVREGGTAPMPVVRPVLPPDTGASQPPATGHAPGGFTKEFLAAMDRSQRSESTLPPPPRAEPPTEAGAFTREFLSLASSAAKEDAPAKPPSTRTSGLDLGPAIPPAPGSVAEQKTGEFTRFFRGQSQEAPQPPATPFTPIVTAPAARKPGSESEPGEFTKVFGQPDLAAPPDAHEEPRPTGLDVGLKRPIEAARFEPAVERPAPLGDLGSGMDFPGAGRQGPRGLSSGGATDQPSFDLSKASPSFEPAWSGETAGKVPGPPPIATPTPRSPVESPPQGAYSFEPAWKEQEAGATRLMTPAGTRQPSPEPVARGPSEFTRIISATSVPGGGAPPMPPPASPGPTGAPSMQIPPVQLHPPVPAAPPFPLQGPPVPVVPQPAIPASMYAPPPSPAVPVPAPKPAKAPAPSYLPLLITLNVLLLAAIMLILYFALKSHH